MPTDFTQITYDDTTHSYSYHGQHLTPVTTIVARLTPEFNKAAILKSSALKQNKTEEEIEEEWNIKRDTSLERGTRVHHYIQSALENRDLRLLHTSNQKLPELQQFRQAWTTLQIEHQATFDKAEWIIGDAELGIAGRLDALIYLTIDQITHRAIFDWKTGKFTTRKYTHQMMLPPFQDLPACEHIKYSIQLGLYRLIIERNTPEKLHTGHILHLPPDSPYELYEELDYRHRLEQWLLHLQATGQLGDPELDKQAKTITQALQQLTPQLKTLSPQTRQTLTTTCQTILNS